MKYVKLFESFNDYPKSKEEVADVLRKNNIWSYKINDDLSVDVKDVRFYIENPTRVINWILKLPLKFNNINGNLDCNNLQLRTLEGCPNKIGGSLFCGNNQLTTLRGAPKEVGGNFDCSEQVDRLLQSSKGIKSRLVSLRGGPKKVGGSFYCKINQLSTLEGAPKEVEGNFDCSYNKLTTLRGAPEYVGGNFDCSNNPVHSLYLLFDGNYKWLNNSIKEYSWLHGTEIIEHRLIDVFLDDDKPAPDLSNIDKIYTIT